MIMVSMAMAMVVMMMTMVMTTSVNIVDIAQSSSALLAIIVAMTRGLYENLRKFTGGLLELGSWV